MNSFDEIALRLKQELKLTKDKELAQALGMGARAWSGRKVRNSFPEDKLYALAAKRPELGIDVQYVLTGVSFQNVAEQEHIAYALAKLVPSMGCGFVISTSYGDLRISSDEADPFQRLAALTLKVRMTKGEMA